MSFRRLRRLGEGVTLKSVGTVLQVAVGLFISVLLNRAYGKEAYGLLVLTYGVTSLAFATCDLGAKITLTRYVPQFLAQRDAARAARMFGGAVVMQVVGTAVFASALFLLSSTIALEVYGQAGLVPLIAVGAFYLAAFALQDLMVQTFQALQDWRREGALTVLFGTCQVAAVVLVSLVLRLDIVWVLVAHAAACVMTVAVSIAWLPASFRRALAPSELRRTGDAIATIVRFGLPLGFQGVYRYSVTWIDKLVLGSVVTPGALAMYYIATSVVNGLLSLFKPLPTVFAPHVAALALADAATVRRQFTLIFRWFLQAALVAALAAFFLVDLVVPAVYGPGYEAVVPLTRVLLVVFVLRACRDPFALFLTHAQGRVRAVLIVGTVLSVTTMAAIAVLVPIYRVEGAVAAVIVGTLASWVALMAVAPDLRAMLPPRSVVVSAGLVAAVGASFALLNLLGVPGAAAGLLLVPLYVAGLRLFGEVTADDVRIAMDVIRGQRETLGRAARRIAWAPEVS